MSRPPTMHAPPLANAPSAIPVGMVVNGGLIDFHEVAAMQAAQYQAPYPSPQVGVAQSGQYIAGPPSFLHLNGQVYRPVVGADLEPVPPPPPPAETRKASTPKPRNSEREIERRVAAKVDEFMAKSSSIKAGKPRSATKASKAHRDLDGEDRIRELNKAMKRDAR